YVWRMAWLTWLKADIANEQGRYQDAEQQATEAMRFYRESGHPTPPFMVLIILSTAQTKLGKFDLARDTLLQVLHRTNGVSGYAQKGEVALVSKELGAIEVHEGNFDQAFEYLLPGLNIGLEQHEYDFLGCNLGLAAAVAAGRGQVARAATLAGAS